MLEIFIPTKINLGDGDVLDINMLSDNFNFLLEKYFQEIQISGFSSKFYEGLVLQGEFSEDLIILCNGLFGEHYFVDYDFFEIDSDFGVLGHKIIGEENLFQEIGKIEKDLLYIINKLTSEELLTISLKKEIILKIKSSFFVLSGIIYLLYKLKDKTDKNILDLQNYDGLEEYKGESRVLLESSVSKQIELKSYISNIEGRIESFISVIKKIII